MSALKVNDTVTWKGSWGSDAPKQAKVTGIMINCMGCKDGDEVQETTWDEVTGRNAIIDLDNGHWAWGFQISPE